ncbi:MAG TPA: ATP-binding protein [Stenomitos sp.]
MTLLQLSNLFNLAAIAALLVVYVFIMQRHPARFFRLWVLAYTCLMGIVASEFVATFIGQHLALTLAEIALGIGGSALPIQAGYALRERPAPMGRLWGPLLGAHGLSVLLLFSPASHINALIPSILAVSIAIMWLGGSFFQHARATLGPGVAWFGLTLILNGLWVLGYPLLAGSDLYWIGFAVSTVLNILMGMGMVILLLEDTAAKLRRQNRTLETAQTELQATQEELVQRNTELAREMDLVDRIANNIPGALMFLNPDLTVRWLNPYLAHHLDRPLEELVGKTTYELFPSTGPTNPRLEAVIRNPQTLHVTGVPYVENRPEGESHYVLDNLYVPLCDESGDLEGLVVMAFDMTDRAENERLQREMIERLQEVDRLKGDFINAASHELRTPLTSILGYTEFMEDGIGGALSAEHRQFVGEIHEGALRLRRIVDDLLDFARLEAGTFTLVPQESDLGQLVHRELASLRPQADEAQIRLAEELPDHPVPLRMDARRIGQVILNLVGNAIKFTRPGGRITVRVHECPGGWRVEVADTGIGIPDGHLERLFDKFYQVDPSTTRERGGTGLGLAISKALIEAHGGALGVQSEPGVGSAFWFTLPHAGDRSHA